MTVPRSLPDAPSEPDHSRAGTRSTRRARVTRPRVLVPLLVVTLVGGAGTVAVLRPWDRPGAAAPDTAADHDTVAVTKGSLSSGVRVTGELSHDAPTRVLTSGQGMLTALPEAGDTVKAGRKLYEVDGVPVTFFTGERPLWRELGPGVAPGPDVRQLKRNLVDLGHAEGLGLAVDDRFTPNTAVAVTRWQKSFGVKRTGRIALGDLVMLPHTTVRVQSLSAQPGSPLGTGPIMTVSGTTLVATAKPADNQLSRFKPDGKVTVRLPDGTTVGGRIRSLVHGGTPPGGDGGAGGGSGPEKTTVTITLDDRKAAEKAGPSPVTITVVGDSVDDALIVPVTALLALDGGGYGVRVVEGAGNRLVRVDLGLVADAKAQISGEIRAGQQVVIPK
ncbi:peptidoglycan-binding protein (plasmid) [Streptomyces sp. BI20]|uniref:peptidoglycan-binding protein n=1 Tax=Streptomyces sp. BI20 TaxID=3403460 RepID=UPI003C780647